jgi:hypothetical protein
MHVSVHKQGSRQLGIGLEGMQDELPHASMLQKASYPLDKWNHDNVGARSWQIAGTQHPKTVGTSTSSLNRALLHGHAAHALTG